MNSLLDLQDKLRTTGEALGKLQAEIPRHPESRALQSNILSLRKLHTNLQREFQEVSDQLGMDVCRYRVLDDRPTAKAFSRAIGNFQEAFSLAYDGLRNGPKPRRNISVDAGYKTELRLAYAFPGSFGVVFTIPNSRLMLDMPTYLDDAVEAVFSIAKSKDDTSIVSKAAKLLGRAPIAAIYDWAKGNAQGNVGASIQWTRSEVVKEAVDIQVPEFQVLAESLERTSEKVTTEVTLVGVLVGADVTSRRFHFIEDHATESIRGRFADAISVVQTARLPERYIALLKKTVEITYATERENITYFLIRLEAAPAR